MVIDTCMRSEASLCRNHAPVIPCFTCDRSCASAHSVPQGENPDEHILILCNAIGSPVDSKYMDVEPKYLAITNYHVVAASDDVVYLWQFRNSFSKQLAIDAPVTTTSSSCASTSAAAAARLQQGRERMFHIDEPATTGTVSCSNRQQLLSLAGTSADCCITPYIHLLLMEITG